VAAPALAGTVGTALAPVRATLPFIADPCAGSCPADRREAPRVHMCQATADGPQGKRKPVRRRGVRSDLGMRATWERGDLGERTLGRRVRVAIEAQGTGVRWVAHGGGERRRGGRLGAHGGGPAAPGEFPVSDWRCSK
jgi:hypothetical protein